MRLNKIILGVVGIGTFITVFIGAFLLNSRTTEENLNNNSKDSHTLQTLISEEAEEFEVEKESTEKTEEEVDQANSFEGEEVIRATFTCSVTRVESSKSAEKDITLEDGKNGEEIFGKTFDLGGNKERTIFAYLEEVNTSVYLKIRIVDKENGSNVLDRSFSAFTPCMKNKCYVYVHKDYITVIEMAEDSSGWYDGYYYLSYDPGLNHSSFDENWNYKETITVYDIDGSIEKILGITRELSPVYAKGEKECWIEMPDERWCYSSISIRSENTEFLSTEQEFCDLANSLLSQYTVENINCKEISLENYWNGLEVEEKELFNNMLKIDTTCSYGILDSDGIVTSDIEFFINAKRERTE